MDPRPRSRQASVNRQLRPPKQSCDQCQARRKKCDRGLPCALCTRSELRCTYVNKLKKRGPKGKVVERLKRQQEEEGGVGVEATDTALVPHAHGSPGILAALQAFSLPVPLMGTPFASSTSSSLAASSASSSSIQLDMVSPLALPPATVWSFSAVLTQDDVYTLVATYFAHIHPCYPFMDKAWFLGRIRSGEPFNEPTGVFGIMLLALCALTMAFISDVICSDKSEAFRARRDKVVAEVIARHYVRPLGKNSALEQVITTYCLALFFSILYGEEAGHFRIAEAAQLARSMGLHRKSTYVNMGGEERTRTIAIYCFILVRNVVCELRLGHSEVVYWGQAPLLPSIADLVESPETVSIGDPRTDELWHLAVLTNIYHIVTPDFCRCARDECVATDCHLSPSDIVRYAHKLEGATAAICPKTFAEIRPALSLFDESRWIEILVAHQWVAAHICHMAARHGIDVTKLEGGKYLRWPLEILDNAAQVVATATVRALHIQGTGLAHRLSYINSCGSAYLETTRVDPPDLEQALANLQMISDAVVAWDPRCWTRCVL